SLTRSNTWPAGRPEAPSPEIRKKVAPPSVLRKTPAFVEHTGPGTAGQAFVATTRIEPPAATPETSSPPSAVAPGCDHVAPPCVVRISPVRAPPNGLKLLSADVKLLKSAMPATTVLKLLSVGSNAIAPIDRLGPAEYTAVHVGLATVALFVFQMP